jgi:hypothetical protein
MRILYIFDKYAPKYLTTEREDRFLARMMESKSPKFVLTSFVRVKFHLDMTQRTLIETRTTICKVAPLVYPQVEGRIE